ncbi:MAG: pheST operon leader peptide PheM [Serratia symbiotica]|nr:pheST operon leader peptide PheM [Serratia symbiotica]NIH11962.1 pheST operon leader peptide PheM [Serratia symbiotica]
MYVAIFRFFFCFSV